MEHFLVFSILYGILPLMLWVKLEPAKIQGILPFVWVVFISSLYEFFGAYIFEISLEYWYLIYKTLAFFSILYFFQTVLKLERLIIYVFSFLFVGLLYLALFHWEEVFFLKTSAYFNAYQTILILLLSIIWFKRIFNNSVTESLVQNPIYFFITGLIIYYCGTVILFLMADYIHTYQFSRFQNYWLLNIILNFVLRTLLMIGIWKARTK
jgi:hypothetical protein